MKACKGRLFKRNTIRIMIEFKKYSSIENSFYKDYVNDVSSGLFRRRYMVLIQVSFAMGMMSSSQKGHQFWQKMRTFMIIMRFLSGITIRCSRSSEDCAGHMRV